MKNLIKTTVALLMALLLSAFAISTTALVPDPIEERTLTIHKYLVEDEDLGKEPYDTKATGLPLDVEDIPGFGAMPLEGIDFLITRAYTEEELNKKGITDLSSYKTIEADYYYLSKYSDEFTIGNTANGTDEFLITTDADGEAEFNFTDNNLPDGVYVVIEQKSTKVSTPANPFLVNIPMDHPGNKHNDGDWLYNIHVYPKNGANKPTLTKTFGDGTYQHSSGLQAEDMLSWELKTQIPVGIDKFSTYKLTDDLSSGSEKFNLVFEEDNCGSNIVVKVFDGGAELKKLNENEHYTVNYTAGELVIDFSDKVALLKEYEEKTLVITFDTTLVASLNNNNTIHSFENIAYLVYERLGKEEESVKSNSIDPKVLFASITIEKVAAGSNNELAGAKFKITTDPTGRVDFLRNPLDLSKDWVVETDANGIAIFGGLYYDLDVGTDYYLVEVAAPEGYNRLNTPVKVTINANKDYTEKIANHKGFTLPMTGGDGVVMFSIIGGVLMLGSLIPLIISKKRKATGVC